MPYDSFAGVTDINQLGFADNLAENFSMYLNWCLVNIGGVQKSGPTYESDTSILRQVSPTKFESLRPGWIANSVTGVFINGVQANSGYTINYRDGQINLSVPASSVQVYYTNALYQIYQTRKNPWFKQVIYGDWVSTVDDFLQVGSGSMDILRKNRINSPFIVIEAVPKMSYKPYQIGGGKWKTQDLIVWVAAGNEWQAKNVMEYISDQQDQVLKLFNVNEVRQYQPYTGSGTLNPSGLNYKQLVDNHFWKSSQIKKVTQTQITDGPPLYIGNLRISFETAMGEL